MSSKPIRLVAYLVAFGVFLAFGPPAQAQTEMSTNHATLLARHALHALQDRAEHTSIWVAQHYYRARGSGRSTTSRCLDPQLTQLHALARWLDQVEDRPEVITILTAFERNAETRLLRLQQESLGCLGLSLDDLDPNARAIVTVLARPADAARRETQRILADHPPPGPTPMAPPVAAARPPIE